MPKIQVPKRRKRGFTLVETLYSMALVTSSAFVLAASIPMAGMSRTKADYLNKVVNFSQRQLELARSLGFDRLTSQDLFDEQIIDSKTAISTNTYSCDTVDSVYGEDMQSILPSAVSRLSLESVDSATKRLTVTVTWTELGRARNYTVSTIVADL